ncbi:MAG: hypothetical protein QOJ79_640 [Actinomycetota bacterium]|jgi:integrase|nr:hypothetical protein [Actinomycetota bacterium]
MASASYRRNGWELRYRDGSGRERTERFEGKPGRRPPEALLDRQGEVERELRRGQYVSREERDTPYQVYYDRWRATRQVELTRLVADDSRAKLHVLPYWSARPLSSIRPSDVDDYVLMLGRKMGPQSVRSCYTVFRGPLRRAIKDGIIANPCIDVPLPKKPDLRKGFDDVLTAVEVDRLMAGLVDPAGGYQGLKTNGRYAAMVFLGAWVGPRWNEVLGLRRCDINPLRQEIAIGRLVVNEISAKTYVKRFSKTSDYRVVPVPAMVMAELERHLVEHCDGSGREDFLFLSRAGTHPLRSNFSRDVVRPAVRRGDLAKRVTWLTLRHTAASLMFDAGLTLFEVQQRLGHKSPAMTAEVYTHLMRERFEDGRRRMDEYMTTKRTPADDAEVAPIREPAAE